jgi:hypothetical protein
LFAFLISRAATRRAARALKQLLRSIRNFEKFPGSHNSLGFAFEKPVKRMSPGAIDIDLAEHGKCHVWMAPADQGLFCGGAFDRGCGHVFGLSMLVLTPGWP